MDPNQSDDTEFLLGETLPQLSNESLTEDDTSSSNDLVEQIQYLYVKIVKARHVGVFDGVELVAEVKIGNYSRITEPATLSKTEWDQVFAFAKECINSSVVEITIKEINKEDHIGRVWFDLSNVPSREQGDSELVPQWYRMEDETGDNANTGEIMVSIWFGTQDDEAFEEARHFDKLSLIESKIYHSPKLWYLRVSVIEAEHIMPGHKGLEVVRFPEFYAKVQVGGHFLETRTAAPSATQSFSNPQWNEDLFLVVAEPLVDSLRVSVEDRVGSLSSEVMATMELPLATIKKRVDDSPVTSSWFDLQSHFGEVGDNIKSSTRFVPRIHLRVSFDGGYHVFDEITMYSSDVRPTDSSLWKPHIGVLEMQILGASWLMPVKTKDGEERAVNAYCVAKYGPEWLRTRTVVDSLSPKWNEQYSWKVYDLCTVVNIGVFDDCRIIDVGDSDYGIGKVRITLSKFETDRVYTHSYPLLVLHPSGVKKMGELQLGIRISFSNVANALLKYTMPVLPNMHYADSLTADQLRSLRLQAKDLVVEWLSQEQPPLGKEVVGYILDEDMWNMRRSKANLFRIMAVLSHHFVMGRSFNSIRNWQKPVSSTLFLVIFLTLVMFPRFILPTILLYVAFLGIWNYRFRPQQPPHMDTRLSHAEMIHPDELDEEFDTFPTSRPSDIVRMRYDRLRSVAGRVQTVAGDVATQLERCKALVSWTDPRATFLFLVLCLVAAIGFYVVPIRVVIALFGLYSFRPPWLRSKLPSASLNFFRRLPATEVFRLLVCL